MRAFGFRAKLLFVLALLSTNLTMLASLPNDSVSENLPGDSIKGKYIFVPDSLESRVRDFIKRTQAEDSRNAFPFGVDPNEKVIVKGDTVNLILKSRNLGRYNRGLFNYLYIPKGTWQFGLTASYGEFSSQDLELISVLSDLDFSGNTFSIKPSINYFIRHNLSVGLRLGYTGSRGNLDHLSVDFDEDLNFDIEGVKYRNESYTAAITLRQYIGLGRNSRFGVFNEVELAFSSGNSRFHRFYDSKPKVTRTTYMDARLNFSPGISVFIMKNVAFNVSFGVFGYYLRNEKQKVNGEDSGNRFSSGANFRFNIFNLNFGVAVQI